MGGLKANHKSTVVGHLGIGGMSGAGGNGSGAAANPEDLTGASFALLMDEASGNITDEIGSIVLTAAGTGLTYSAAGDVGYNPGISLSGANGDRFYNGSAQAALNIGTGDANIFVRIAGNTSAAKQVWFATGLIATGGTGLAVVTPTNAWGRGVAVEMYATDGTNVNAAWGSAGLNTVLNDGAPHSYEVRINRTAGTVELFVDTATQGTVDISSLAGKSINTTACGVGDFYGFAIWPVNGTIYFVRQKNSLN